MVGIGSLYVSGRRNIVGLFVAEDAPIRGAADLVGKTIGVSNLVDNSILGVDAWLEKNGVDRTLVKAVEIPLSEMGAALQRGTIAAAIIAEPFLSASKDQTREIPRMFDAIGRRWAIEVWYGRREFVKANPDLTNRFMDAVYATSKSVNRNPERVVPLLSTYSKIPVERLQDMSKPIFSESFDASLVQPALDLSYKYKQLSQPATVADLMR